MDKKNMYPEMPTAAGVPDQPPTYNQTFPSAPSAADMTSSGVQPTPFQQQPQSYVQAQPILIQNLPPNQIPPLGPRPCIVTCPSCHEKQMSNTVLEASTKTHLFALALCVVGLCCCSCIPYFVDNCKNVNHYCKNCNAYLGVYAK